MSDNLPLLFAVVLLYTVFGFGVATSKHWLKRRLNFTGLYAWSLIVAYLILVAFMPNGDQLLSHGMERLLTWALVLATFLSLVLGQASEREFEKYIGRATLNDKPQRYGSPLWWIGVVTIFLGMGLLATGFPAETRTLINWFDDPFRFLK